MQGIPVSEQTRQEFGRDVGIAPTRMQEDLLTGNFNRAAYDNAKFQRLAQEQQRIQGTQPQQTQAQPQNENAQVAQFSPDVTQRLHNRLAEIRQRAISQTQQAVQPVQPAQVDTPLQPIVPQNDQAPKETRGDDDWFKALMDGSKSTTEQPAQQTPPAPAQEQTQDFLQIKREEASRIGSYLEENQKYYNAVEMEAKRRGVDPLLVAQALSQKPINEVVDFALGNNNAPVQAIDPNAQRQTSPDFTDLDKYTPKTVQTEAQSPFGRSDTPDWQF